MSSHCGGIAFAGVVFAAFDVLSGEAFRRGFGRKSSPNNLFSKNILIDPKGFLRW
jgi:hypothetical protein